MKRVFCFTCAAEASAEVAPDYIWKSRQPWGRTDFCCRCGRQKMVMEYDLVPAKEVRDGKGDEEAETAGAPDGRH